MDESDIPEEIKQAAEAWSPWDQVDQMCDVALEKLGHSAGEPSFDPPKGLPSGEAMIALRNQMRVFCDQHQERVANMLRRLYSAEGLTEMIDAEHWTATQMLLGIGEFVMLHQLDVFAKPELTTIFPIPECGSKETFFWLVEKWWPHCGRDWWCTRLAMEQLLNPA
jgi:hypothetical protein